MIIRVAFRSVIIWFVSIIVVPLFIIANANATPDRIALLVGVSDYQNVLPLVNTLNDVELISSSLQELDFDVWKLQNPTQEEFRSSLAEFQYQAETAEVALIYFAGHGIEISGKNYLLPVDTKAEDFTTTTVSSVSIDELLLSVDRARQLRIVILDSCRDNPFLGIDTDTSTSLPNTSSTGLAPPSPDRGTLVAFAAKDGARALDSISEGATNSPYATALAKQLVAKDLEIGLLFRKVRDSVLKLTRGYQEPHTYGALTGKPFFLAGSNQDVNNLENEDRQFAWSRLGVEEEKLLERSAIDGDTRAILGLAYMKLDPDQKRYDPTEAAKLLAKAAGEGEPEAQFELGKLYEQGIGVDQDTKKAVSLYQAAADLDFPDAINDLGFLNYQGGLNIVRNQKVGLGLFQRAADLGHPEAMFNIAALIDDGKVVGKNEIDAAKYLFRALRSGDEVVLEQLTNNPTMFKIKTRQELQRVLLESDFYEGQIDGSFGPQTNRGLRQAFGITN